jgi:hypothetical protein
LHGPAAGPEARRPHVGVADRLDPLQAEAISQPVEGAEDLIEDSDDPLGSGPLREGREVDHVGEDDRDIFVALGDDPGLVLQPLRGRPWEDVQEEAFGARQRGIPGAERVEGRVAIAR